MANVQKKGAKKSIQKPAIKKVVRSRKPAATQKPIGEVTHFFDKIKVAIIKFKKPIRIGGHVAIRGSHTDISFEIKSMQWEHAPITVAKKGKEVGIKVPKPVRSGDEVYPV